MTSGGPPQCGAKRTCHGPLTSTACATGAVTRCTLPEAVVTSYSPGSVVSTRMRPRASQRTTATGAGGTAGGQEGNGFRICAGGVAALAVEHRVKLQRFHNEVRRVVAF